MSYNNQLRLFRQIRAPQHSGTVYNNSNNTRRQLPQSHHQHTNPQLKPQFSTNNYIEPTRSFLNFRPQQNTQQKIRSTRGSSQGLSEEQKYLGSHNTTLGNFHQNTFRSKQALQQQDYQNSSRQGYHPFSARSKIQQKQRQRDPQEKTIQFEKYKAKEIQKVSIKQTGKNMFEILYPIGKGGFGKVWKVMSKKNKQIYAMKQMYKAKIIHKKSVNSVMNQRKLLAKLTHPFLINMTYAFQDRQNLYLVMDYINGGDLRYHLGKKKFNQEETKFFIANIIVGLQYLNENKIIHRDIKPQNLVLGSDGYLRITDLGISRQLRQENYQDTSGTPGYMAPQVICRRNHSYEADFFAIGVIGYEFMMGRRPYNGRNRKQIRQMILAKQAGIRLQQIPKKWSIQAADFINRLLLRNPANRLGHNSIQQLKSHPWMENMDWKALVRKQLKPPYCPMSIEQDYEQYRKQISQDTVPDNIEQNMLLLRDTNVQKLFEGYTYAGLQQKRSRIPSTMETESQQKKYF